MVFLKKSLKVAKCSSPCHMTGLYHIIWLWSCDSWLASAVVPSQPAASFRLVSHSGTNRPYAFLHCRVEYRAFGCVDM